MKKKKEKPVEVKINFKKLIPFLIAMAIGFFIAMKIITS